MELPKVFSDSRRVDIEIWYLPLGQDGLLLYRGQEPGKGDYISLILFRGFLRFVFDLGSGSANIT